jgi:VWFA-related protein
VNLRTWIAIGALASLTFVPPSGSNGLLASSVHASPRQGMPSTQQSAQPPPAGRQNQPQPAFRTEATYVRVDAYPTRDGEMVPDLTAADFEILEDGVAQRIDQCEFVEVRTGGPQSSSREADNVASARRMAEEARARVFVVFLDTYHVGTGDSRRMRTALSALLRRMLGPDDVVGIMAPQMSAADVTFTRQTGAIEGMLDRDWIWGRRDQTIYREPEESDYEACYPERRPAATCYVEGRKEVQPENFYKGIAREMVERRREKITLDALGDLVRWLRGVREERKAVLVVSDGWRLFTPDQSLTRQGGCDRLLEQDTAGVRRPGRSTAGTDSQVSAARQKCDDDRRLLASLDNAWTFRELLDRANRANVSFYPIDPRGLPAFDTSMADTKISEGGVTQPLLAPAEDAPRLTARIETLRTLASATDGIAVVNNNDIESGLRRVAADLTSYYLLGYYSTNTKPDGRFRKIAVRVKRAGVGVRARRGYLAATPEEVAAGAPAGPAPASAAAAATTTILANALAGVAAAANPSRIRARLSWLDGGAAGARVWAVAEVDEALARTGGELASGAEVAATLSSASGDLLGQRRAAIAAGSRVAVFDFAVPALDRAGLVLRLHVRSPGGGFSMTETLRVPTTAPAGPVGTSRLLRRGIGAASQYVPTADPRFARTERLRVEVPVIGEVAQTQGELLDRTGKPIALPVVCLPPAATLVEPALAVCELALAPLARGEYGIRVAVTIGSRRHEVITAFRLQ